MVIHNKILVAVLQLFRRNIFFWATFLLVASQKSMSSKRNEPENNKHLRMKTPVW